MRVRTCLICVLLSVCSLAVVVAPARGAVLTYNLDFEFSSGTNPFGPPPWLTLSFDDHNSSGSVTMTMTATNLVSGEFVSEWDVNLDPALIPASLAISAPTKTGTFNNPTINKGVNGFKADGDGLYDVQFLFDTAGNGRFGQGEAAVFTISGIPTLTASSFDFLSAPAGGVGPFVTAAHVQGIGSGSGWVTQNGGGAPEPSGVAIATGIAAIAGARRRRRARL